MDHTTCMTPYDHDHADHLYPGDDRLDAIRLTAEDDFRQIGELPTEAEARRFLKRLERRGWKIIRNG